MHQTEEATIIKLAEKKPTEEDEETDMSDSEDQSSEEEDETQKESKEDATDEEGNDVLNREKQEKKAQLKQEDEQEHKENQEDKRDKKAEAKQSREDSQRTFQNDDDDMAKMLYVTFGEKRVTKEDINKHFSQFGRVLDVLVPCEGFAMVTFQSASLAQWLGGMERQTLYRTDVSGGPISVQLPGSGPGWASPLPGGSGRGRGIRRAPVSQQNATNPLRCIIDKWTFNAIEDILSRNPHTLTAAQLYDLIRWSPAKFRQYCAASRLATPVNSPLTHEARVFAWRFW